jgi:hypothetical protein
MKEPKFIVTKQSPSSLALGNANIGRSPAWMVLSVMLVECSEKVPSLNPGKDRDYPDTHSPGFNLTLHTNSRMVPSTGPEQLFIIHLIQLFCALTVTV